MKNLTPIFIIILLFLQACQDEQDINGPDKNNYLKVAEGVSDDSFDVKMYAEDSLFVGYDKVYIKLTDKKTGQVITHATLQFHPLMNMGTFSHACPFENPAIHANADGYFEGAVLFSMAGKNSWSLTLDISWDGRSGQVVLPIDKVMATTPVRKIVIIDTLATDQGSLAITKYPVSLVMKKWKVGNNPFEITAHRMESMTSFPAVTDLTFEIVPEMPSMGHGSPNNINPVHMANGHYVGSVNFTMTGDWRINLIVKKGNRIISKKAWFDVLF